MMKTLRFFLSLCLCVQGAITLPAQTVPAVLVSALDNTLDSMRDVSGAKSFSAAIQFSDGAVWVHAKGISSVTPSVAVTPNDVYLIGSVTKTLTSACVLQLADEGILQLDDSLHEWLDTMPFINPDITIRQLLQHTSGLFDVLANPAHQDSLMADMSRIWTAEELIMRFMAAPPASPGDGWAYCNTNYFLLGMIIKEATGNPFYTEIRNRFLSPLSLSSFAIPAFEPLSNPVAHLWLDINGDAVLDDAHNFYFNYLALNSTAGAAGGYYATPTDCSKWMRKYMRGDLLSASMMAQSRTTVFAQGSQGGLYGLGMMKNSFLGYEAYGHGGDLAYHASSWYFPALDISITVLTNDNNKNSWALLPVVTALLRTYLNHGGTNVASPELQIAKLKAWPNPFADKLTIGIEAGSPLTGLQITMQDVLGRTIHMPYTTTATTGLRSFIHLEKLDGLSPGMYVVTIATREGDTYTLKVLK